MNIQALMKQAQKMQSDVLKSKEEINKKLFEEKYSSVKVIVNGKKEIQKIEIDKNIELDSEDIEMLEDMIMVALNNVFTKIDEETEKTLGKYGQGLSGLM